MFLNWESSVFPGRHSRGNTSPKLGFGVVFLDVSSPCTSKTVGDAEVCPSGNFKAIRKKITFISFFSRYQNYDYIFLIALIVQIQYAG